MHHPSSGSSHFVDDARSSGESPSACDSAATCEPAVQVVRSLLRAAHLLRGATAKHFSEFGLNDARFDVLREVQNSAPSACSQAELAARLKQSESNISMLVERMRADGLLERHRSTKDRRKCILLPTEQGLRVLEQVNACHNERMSALMRGLDREQHTVLSHLLGLLIDSLSESQSAETPSSRRTALKTSDAPQSEPPKAHVRFGSHPAARQLSSDKRTWIE